MKKTKLHDKCVYAVSSFGLFKKLLWGLPWWFSGWLHTPNAGDTVQVQVRSLVRKQSSCVHPHVSVWEQLEESSTLRLVEPCNTVSPLHTKLQVLNFQRWAHACQPRYTSCCSSLLYFSKYCTIKLKCFLFCLFFYVCITCVKSIISLLQCSSR